VNFAEGKKAAEKLVVDRALADPELRPYVRLHKWIGSYPVPVNMLHYPGYSATPALRAPLCSDRDGPYGEIEWCHPDRMPLPLCERCVGIRSGVPRDGRGTWGGARTQKSPTPVREPGRAVGRNRV
jgi:hypothetical protein